MNQFLHNTKKQYQNVKNGIRDKLHQITTVVTNRDNKISNSLILNTNTESLKYTYDKLSWSIGETVLINHTPCVIQQIQYMDTQTHKPDFQDIITVIFPNGFSTKFDRYQLQSRSAYIQNRKNITKYYTIEIYSPSSNQWNWHYIDNYAANWFSVNDKKHKYNIWSNIIRCCAPLLNLTQVSNIFVFDAHTMQWCHGKIMTIKKQEISPNIFEVHYTKYNKIFTKYIHQFSASIALNDDTSYTTACSVYDEKNIESKSTETCATDLKYYRLLLQGYVDAEYVNDNILSIIIQYVEYSYELVMVIESKTFSIAIKNRNCNLKPKTLPPIEMSSWSPLHPFEIKIRSILLEKSEYTRQNFENAKKNIELKLIEDEYDEHNFNYDFEINHYTFYDFKINVNISNVNDSLSLESGRAFSPLPSDW